VLLFSPELFCVAVSCLETKSKVGIQNCNLACCVGTVVKLGVSH
jgi:hypothetical protein